MNGLYNAQQLHFDIAATEETLSPLSIIRHACLAVCAGSFFAQAAIAEPIEAAALPADLNMGQYEQLAELVHAAYQRFLQGEASEEAILDALYPFSHIDPLELPRLDAWVAAQPESGIALLVHAYVHADKGWDARGQKYIGDTARGQIEEMHRLFERARASYASAIGKLERCSVCYAELIAIAMADGRSKDMRELFSRALASDPLAAGPAHAYYHALQARWGGAEGEQQAFAEQFRRTHPDNSDNKRIRGNQLAEQAAEAEDRGDYQQALALYDEAIASWPGPRTYTEQGMLLARLERAEEAQAAYENAIRLSTRPSSVNDYEQRGWAKQQLGRFDEAAADLHKAVQLGSEWAFESLYRQYAGNSGYPVAAQPEKAFELGNEAALLGMPQAYWAVGGMHYFGLGVPRNLEKAASWFERASTLGVAGAKADLALMYWRGDGVAANRDRAIVLWREAMERGDPRGDEKLRTHLSSLEYFWHVNVHRWINKQKQQWQVVGEMFRMLLAALMP
jgi:tetratricopeptide (TPR) repeat protein